MAMDGTEQTKDTSAKEQDSSAIAKGTSPAETPGTFTKAQIDKAVSDALSKAGRDAKSLSELQKKLETGMADLTTKQTAWQKQQEEAEETAVADDLPALTALRARRQKKADDEAKNTELTERETKLAKRETEIADIIERDRILNRTQLAAEVATERGVSIDAILKLAKEDTREAYETVAELLPKVKEPTVLITDSGRARGYGIDANTMSWQEQIKYGLEHIKK
ncbi:MAG: hypothetical protein MUP49_05630 [Dehalococcoidia bacterium]|nr:hypothetical protein [Dehalococcoidia bacterium]